MICKNSCCKKEFDGRKRYCPHCGRDKKWVPTKRKHSTMPLAAMFMLPALLASAGIVAKAAASKPKYCECCGQVLPEAEV